MEKNIIEKSNILNTMQKIDYDMSLNEFRFFCMYLSKLNSREPEKRTVVIQIAEFEKLFDVKFNTSLFKKRIRRVASANVEIREGKKLSIVQLYSRFAWLDTDTCTELEITCNQDIQKYIFELQKNYTSYRLGNISKLTSLVKIRLYELMKQYEFIKSVELKLEDLQCMIFSVEKRFNDFRSRVLEPAIKDINEYTDITVTYEKVLKCRKCVALKFYIESKEQPKAVECAETETVKEVETVPKWNGFTDEQEDELYDYIRREIKNIYKSAEMLNNRTEAIYNNALKELKKHSDVKHHKAYIRTIIDSLMIEERKKPQKEEKPRSYDINQFEKFAINYPELQKVENGEVSESHSEPVLEPVKEIKVICQEKIETAVPELLSTVSDDIQKVFDETPEGIALFSKVLEIINTTTEYNATISILDIVDDNWKKFEGVCKQIIVSKLKEKENAPEIIDVFNKF